MSCDYRVMTDGKGWMSMNENLIGLPLPSNVCRLLFARCHPNVMRDICLGKRWTSQEALPAGLIDDIRPYGQPVVDRAVEIAEAEGYRSAKGSLGLIKVSERVKEWLGVADDRMGCGTMLRIAFWLGG